MKMVLSAIAMSAAVVATDASAKGVNLTWVDYPGRLWIARANLGAIYSPDGMTIQFDNGTIWQRALEAPPPPPRRRRR